MTLSHMETKKLVHELTAFALYSWVKAAGFELPDGVPELLAENLGKAGLLTKEWDAEAVARALDETKADQAHTVLEMRTGTDENGRLFHEIKTRRQ